MWICFGFRCCALYFYLLPHLIIKLSVQTMPLIAVTLVSINFSLLACVIRHHFRHSEERMRRGPDARSVSIGQASFCLYYAMQGGGKPPANLPLCFFRNTTVDSTIRHRLSLMFFHPYLRASPASWSSIVLPVMLSATKRPSGSSTIIRGMLCTAYSFIMPVPSHDT
jgi:hypothetical protein